MMRDWKLAGLVMLAVMGCKGGEDTEVVDTDTDTDSETDTDTETEPEVDYGTFAGTLDYKYSTDSDGVVCDAQFELSGETFTGNCGGCDYAFEMTSTVKTENSTEDCVYNPVLTFTENTIVQDPIMAFFPSYTGAYAEYTNVLMNGVALDYSAYGYGFYEGPYWQQLHSDDSTLTTFTQTGNDLAWTYVQRGSLGYTGWGYPVCDALETPPVDGSGVEIKDGVKKATAQTINETVACDVTKVDVYTFTGTGSTVRVSADNVDAATAMDLWLIIEGGDECIGWYADDSLTCAFAPADGYQCPAIEVESKSGTTYQVLVLPYAGCGSEAATEGEGNYVFGIDGATATLKTDDLSLGFDYDVSMNGTITPPGN